MNFIQHRPPSTALLVKRDPGSEPDGRALPWGALSTWTVYIHDLVWAAAVMTALLSLVTSAESASK